MDGFVQIMMALHLGVLLLLLPGFVRVIVVALAGWITDRLRALLELTFLHQW